MTTKELHQLEAEAGSGDPHSCVNLATAMMCHDYYKAHAKATLILLYNGLLSGLGKVFNTVPGVTDAVRPYIDTLRSQPSADNLKRLIANAVNYCVGLSPSVSVALSSGIARAFIDVSRRVVATFDELLPDWRKYQTLADTTVAFVNTPQLDEFNALVSGVIKYGNCYCNRDLATKLLCSAVICGYAPAAAALSKLFGLGTDDVTIATDSPNQFRLIPAYPANNLDAARVFLGEFISITLNKKVVRIPKTTQYFGGYEESTDRYLRISVDSESQKSMAAARYRLESIVASLCVAFNGKVSFEVIDIAGFGLLSDFTSAKPIESHVTQENSGLTAALAAISDDMNSRLKKYGDFQRVVEHNAELPCPLKILVVNDIRESIDYKNNGPRLLELIQKCYRAGYFTIWISDDKYADDKKHPCINCITDTLVPDISPYDVIRIPGIDATSPDWLLSYIAKNASVAVDENATEEGLVFTQFKAPGKNSSLMAEIGHNDDADIEFTLDAVSHPHAFIIGKSGSGKSVLLHNMISSLIAKYSPYDLELYLLDLKLGGVEFNRYKGVKHARVLLVDNSDIQVVCEIMRDISTLMAERAKKLRDAGCSNISEYNIANKDNRMPQVVIFADECHQLFINDSNSGSSQIHNEIVGVLTKVAKEGRSQGVHLVLATQTLSGAEIPSGILNNISDYYLLNCVPSDAERLVNGSSKHTSGLQVGQAYYKHVEYETLFQGNYISPAQSEHIIKGIADATSSFDSHPQVYFNGSIIYELNSSILPNVPAINVMPGVVGRSVDLSQRVIDIQLGSESEENLLVTGLNDKGNASRATITFLCSQIMYAKKRNTPLRVIVLNAYKPDDSRSYDDYLKQLSSNGLIEYIERPSWGACLKDLAENIETKSNTGNVMLYILGQELMSELRRNDKLVETDNDSSAIESEDSASLDLSQSLFNLSALSSEQIETFQDAINRIIEDGPQCGVNTVIQVDKVDKLLYLDGVRATDIYNRFRHVVILRTDSRSAMQLNLDEIKPEELSSDENRLRAFYYDHNSDRSVMFTPFTIPDIDTLTP